MNKLQIAKYFLVNPGPRPPYPQVAEYLWGANCNFDWEGDSYPDPHTTEWTSLWMTRVNRVTRQSIPADR